MLVRIIMITVLKLFNSAFKLWKKNREPGNFFYSSANSHQKSCVTTRTCGFVHFMVLWAGSTFLNSGVLVHLHPLCMVRKILLDKDGEKVQARPVEGVWGGNAAGTLLLQPGAKCPWEGATVFWWPRVSSHRRRPVVNFREEEEDSLVCHVTTTWPRLLWRFCPTGST